MDLSKGMVEMVEMQHMDYEAGAERETIPQLYIGLPLDRGVSVKLSRDEQQGLNGAEIILPPAQVERFMRALIEHPILLPTSYSQSSAVEDGKHMLRLASVEAFSDFVERLTDTLGAVTQKK
ncbi:hypothetical protein [Planococcus sp. SSTMD024]|uniref:hypothetical protein n=1 Tax=Planococcus sp. SSTMD024 TaxID=3242163 RepID=UPI00351E81D6